MKEPKSEVHNIDCVEYMKTLPDNYFKSSTVFGELNINETK